MLHKTSGGTPRRRAVAGRPERYDGQRDPAFSPRADRHPEISMLRMAGSFYEFFAGAGMARAGLGCRWRCLFANDFDRKKAEIYSRNWGDDRLLCGDVRNVTTDDLTGRADLAWASFPCQDLSLAGNGAGLRGERSGTFWPFWRLMTALADEGRAPRIIVLENVCGALSSRGGRGLPRDLRGLAGWRLPVRRPDCRRRSFRTAVAAPPADRRHRGRYSGSRCACPGRTGGRVPPNIS